MDFNHVDPKLLASGSDDAKGNQSVHFELMQGIIYLNGTQ